MGANRSTLLEQCHNPYMYSNGFIFNFKRSRSRHWPCFPFYKAFYVYHRSEILLSLPIMLKGATSIEECQEEKIMRRLWHTRMLVLSPITIRTLCSFLIWTGLRSIGIGSLEGTMWFWACANSSSHNCPPSTNPEADFGETLTLLSIYLDIVVAVQKSG